MHLRSYARRALATVLVSCSFLAQIGFASPNPAYPVLFVHGLNSSSTQAWGELRRMLTQAPYEWADGGTLSGHPAKFDAESGGHRVAPADFYTLDFSSSYGLTFQQQGVELGNAIGAVLRANPGKAKVILVAHSMGGLAARAYLQASAAFRDDVAALITVGTPHQGSREAQNCNRHSLMCALALQRPNSVGNDALIPGSTSLGSLNAPGAILPTSVHSYVSIVVTWDKGYTLTDIATPSSHSTPDGRVYGEEGDGVVTVTSQDLSRLFSFTPSERHKTEFVKFPKEPGPGCADHHSPIWDINQVHTCETRSWRVIRLVLRAIYSVPAVEPAEQSRVYIPSN